MSYQDANFTGDQGEMLRPEFEPQLRTRTERSPQGRTRKISI